LFCLFFVVVSNCDLQLSIKTHECSAIDERTKLELSIKQLQLLNKQKEEQSLVMNGYEEKLKIFEQLLNVADSRASCSEDSLRTILHELTTLK
jgi:hypothetical protein